MDEQKKNMSSDFWTWAHLISGNVDDAEKGLITEARRLAREAGGGRVAVVAAGKDKNNRLRQMGDYGADRVYHLQSPYLTQYNGELFAEALEDLLRQCRPACMLFAHNHENADLVGRIGALIDSPVITRAVDAHTDDNGAIKVVRPIANGYLFETIKASGDETKLVTFLTGALADPEPVYKKSVDVQIISPALNPDAVNIKSVEIIPADPETLNLEDADIIVSGGRGIGKNKPFDIIYRLARAIGGSVAGTRPVIDQHILPVDRQIGQTGKTVSPRLIVNCGISGANEYTAGIERSQLVIAINIDGKARIFRFADLGIVGDLNEVLPLLVEQLGKRDAHSGS